MEENQQKADVDATERRGQLQPQKVAEFGGFGFMVPTFGSLAPGCLNGEAAEHIPRNLATSRGSGSQPARGALWCGKTTLKPENNVGPA